MPRKFKEAQQINKLKVIEAAAKLGISQPTLSAWGGGKRKSPGLDHLENMANLYGVILFCKFRMRTSLHALPILDH